MKNKIVASLILFFLLVLNCFAQSNVTSVYKAAINELLSNEAEEIILGDITKLSRKYPLDLISLAKCNKESYRILRNTIYAKYGHIFKSTELTEYFSQFSWYHPEKTVSDTMLSSIDKINLEIIKKYETMDESTKSIQWSSDKKGVWQLGYGMASGWGERFVIYDDNKIEYLYSQMRELQIIKGFSGEYIIKGNVLIIYVDKIVYIEHTPGYLKSDGIEYKWNEQKENSIVFAKPMVLKFPITPIRKENKYGMENVLSIEIGGSLFYQMSKDVNKKN
jgi:hypothetical protein